MVSDTTRAGLLLLDLSLAVTAVVAAEADADFSARSLLLPVSAPICEQVWANSCRGDLPVFSCKEEEK